MVRCSTGMLVSGCLSALTANAAADQDPKETIRQAITAMGGIENMRLIRATHTRFTSHVYLEHGSAELQGEIWQQCPDRFKQIVQINLDGKTGTVVYTVRGEDAWSILSGVQRQLDGLGRAELCATLFEEYVATLLPLLEDQRLTLTTVPVKAVNSRPAHGIRVALAKLPTVPDVTIFFDQETHLPVQRQRQRLNRLREDGVESVSEERISDYRTIDFRIDAEKRLHDAGIDTSDASLLAFLKKQVLSEAERARCQELITQLGDDSYAVRKEARKERPCSDRPRCHS